MTQPFTTLTGVPFPPLGSFVSRFVPCGTTLLRILSFGYTFLSLFALVTNGSYHLLDQHLHSTYRQHTFLFALGSTSFPCLHLSPYHLSHLQALVIHSWLILLLTLTPTTLPNS